MTLFDVPVTVQPLKGKESDTQRLTRRNREKLANAVHPATHRKLLEPAGATCGGCVFADNIHYHDRSYWKCQKHRLGDSHSAASDIRKSWPACVLYEAKP